MHLDETGTLLNSNSAEHKEQRDEAKETSELQTLSPFRLARISALVLYDDKDLGSTTRSSSPITLVDSIQRVLVVISLAHGDQSLFS